jgi:2,3-bisphosphoglycerate-independent phosphoglycerate mutase
MGLESDRDAPLGFLTALGLGLRPDPHRTWACLDFSHLAQRREVLLLVSPHRTGQTLAERQQLLAAIAPDVDEAGWQIHSHDAGPLLLSTDRAMEPVQTAPLPLLEGLPVWEHLPRGRGGAALHRLLNSGQMALAQYPGNRERLRAGRLPINTPWLWGIAPGWPVPEPNPDAGWVWSADPVFLGMAVAAGWRIQLGEEGLSVWPDPDAVLARLSTGPVVLHLHLPALMACHDQSAQRLAYLHALDRLWLTPLMTRLRKQRSALTILAPSSLSRASRNPFQSLSETTHPASGPVSIAFQSPAQSQTITLASPESIRIPWVRTPGWRLGQRRWFWQRRVWGAGPDCSPTAFNALWR